MESRHRSRIAVGSPAAFRPSAKEYVLHPLEKALLLTALALLIFLPWALGGMRLWAQQIAFGLAALAFVLSLIPRTYDDRYHAGGNLRLHMWPKLLRFPVFWLGLAYFAIILIQIANPAWTYRSSSAGWWLEGRDYITWLPHGIEGTPIKMNGWRTLLIQGGAWLLVCALWVGITRRRTAKQIATTVALNGALVALAVLAQRLVGNDKFLWLWEVPAPSFVAGFPYKNHAAEFLCLVLALCLGLVFWYTHQAERERAKSHPGHFWLLASGIVVTGLLNTYGRAASLAGGFFFTIVVAFYFYRTMLRAQAGPPRWVNGFLIAISLGLMGFAITQVNSEKIIQQFDELRVNRVNNSSFALSLRQQATQATHDMAADSPIFGHGAGSFRYLFPQYQKNYPLIWTYLHWTQVGNENKQVPRRYYWEYAHNDFAQLRAEIGWVGVGFAIALLGFIMIAAWRTHILAQHELLIMLGGPVLVGLTAAVDFPMHNPAVLFTSAVVVSLVLRWAQFSRR